MLTPSNPLRQSRKARFAAFAVGGFLLLLLTAALVHPHDEDRPAALQGVAFDQRLGEQAPLDLRFVDASGKVVRFGDYFGKRPVVLNFVYYSCEDFCPLLIDGLVRTLRAISPKLGDDFAVVTVSFDPRDTPALAATKKNEAIERYGRAAARDGWHFLTGEAESIRRLTESAGFRYNYDDATARFGHAAGVIVLTPTGKLARYFYGAEIAPRDLRLGLIEAAEGRIGSPIDKLLLFCYHYDPATGKYGLLITNVIRVAAAVTALALAGFILFMLRGERRQRPQASKSG
jgi:protein SCO1/2